MPLPVPSLLSAFFHTLKYPPTKTLPKPLVQKTFESGYFWLLTFCWSLGAGVLVGLFPQAGENAVLEGLNEFEIGFALFGIGYASIYEELTFRAFLRGSKLGLGFGIGFWAWFWLVSVGEISIFTRLSAAPGLGEILDTFVLPFLLGGLSVLCLQIQAFFTFLQKAQRQHRRFLLWLSIVTFAWIHALNFADVLDFWYLTPLLTLPQLIIGLTLSVVRLRYGLGYAIFIHALNNACGIALASLLLRATSEADLGLIALGVGLLGLFFLGSIGVNVHALVRFYQAKTRS